jgi:2',3'-cyclic-nucleotide 2'-phosphodiesterase (5'-nucleotidase family)
MKQIISIIFLWGICCLVGCRTLPKQADRGEAVKPIVILYENDVHCAVDGYAKLAGVEKMQRLSTPYVTTVSCGDFVQGGIVGTVSQGEHIIEIMNRVGYDVVTLGNHEFDYGREQLFKLTEKLEAEVVNANFRNTETNRLLYKPYQMIRYGEVDVAYIGFTTTVTTEMVSPLTFQDEKGKVVYDFTKERFYENAQAYVDDARANGAEYVVVLSHLGDLPDGEHPTSLNLIARTTGIDVILDGHAHRMIPDTLVNNKKGEPVLLTSTGTQFEWIGVLTISEEGKIRSHLVSTKDQSVCADKEIEAFVETIKEKTLADGRKVVGVSAYSLSVNDTNGNRLVRSQEAPIGNFCADAFRIVLDTDVSLINGGALRGDIPKGEVTYNDLYAVLPFNNTLCKASMTGQQLLDALEMSVRWLPYEYGEFMQVSGIRFNVDSTVVSPVVMGEDGLFSHVADGPRRVSELKILNKENGEYRPVELEKRYMVAGLDYQIKHLGSQGIFRYDTLEEDNMGQEVDIAAIYLEKHLGGKIGTEYSHTDGRIDIK